MRQITWVIQDKWLYKARQLSTTIALVSTQFFQILIYITQHQYNYNNHSKEKGCEVGLLSNVSKVTLIWNGNSSWQRKLSVQKLTGVYVIQPELIVRSRITAEYVSCAYGMPSRNSGVRFYAVYSWAHSYRHSRRKNLFWKSKIIDTHIKKCKSKVN